MRKITKPNFWSSINFFSVVLLPASCLFVLANYLRKFFIKPYKLNIPVICVGNITVGGAGKTPLAIFLGQYLKNKGFKIAYLSRGVGGCCSNQKVDLSIHEAKNVGDEPLLLAKIAPTYVGKDRVTVAEMAVKDGADLIVMDDGMQHYALHKDITILTVDADYQFGNRLILPAGPLRQSIGSGIKDADIIAYVDYNGKQKSELLQGAYRLSVQPKNANVIKNKKFIVLCSIASPAKFIETIKMHGGLIIDYYIFTDHYIYSEDELKKVFSVAEKQGCKVITTAKDAVKLPKHFLKKVEVLNVIMQNNVAFTDRLLDLLSEF